MNMIDIIAKKRDSKSLDKEEIKYAIDGYVQGLIPDYQMSAFLMAIYLNGLNKQERFILTDVMLNSGETIDLSLIEGIKVDKHSTGGVGDKTSLVVAPLASSFGIKMAKMSGRGLGHTGGTLDKLESIPGFKIEIEKDVFIKQVNEIGLAIIGQSSNITPADKKIYALRDVTATVESIDLIASSIMSKKLASGADYIVLDVKVGKGAFMKNLDSAHILAQAMVEIGNLAGVNTTATLTDMSKPLGRAIGNSLEVIEAIETLKGRGPADFTKLCLSLTAEILLIAKVANNEAEAFELVEKALNNGSGLEKLAEMIKYQGGNHLVINDYTLMELAGERVNVIYHGGGGYVKSIDALAIGEASMLLGAGRLTKDESIDHGVGIYLNKVIGDYVEEGDVLAIIYTNGKKTREVYDIVKNAYQLDDQLVEEFPIIMGIVR